MIMPNTASLPPVRRTVPIPLDFRVVKLIKVEKNIIQIEDADMVDGTPVLDIKPYLLPPETLGEVKRGWLDKKKD